MFLVACSTSQAAPDYDTVRANLDAKRKALGAELDHDREATIDRARALLVATMRDDILPAWNGTEWAMNGISQVPHEGRIACGYFITTTLLHAGFDLERARMGQQASTYITQSLVTENKIWRSSEQPIAEFVAKLRKGGDGLYIVGLDNHVGFVIVDGDDTWFHHSGPGVVRREPALTASFLSTSHYREAAKLFDDVLVEKWLRGEAIHTVLPKRRANSSSSPSSGS